MSNTETKEYWNNLHTENSDSPAIKFSQCLRDLHSGFAALRKEYAFADHWHEVHELMAGIAAVAAEATKYAEQECQRLQTEEAERIHQRKVLAQQGE